MLLSSFLAALLAGQALPEIVEAPVLDRMVERGEILSVGDFTTEPLSPPRARGAMTPDAVSGMEAARRLRVGAIVRG